MKRRLERITLLCLVTLAAFALRIYLLGAQNLWWDEALAIWAVRKGFWPMTLWTAGDVHPPLFFWGLYGLTRLAGQTEFAVRFPSLLYGLLTVPLAYQLGRKLFNGRVGIVASLLLATARFHVWWSQETRMYILAGLLGTASLYFFVSWWKGELAGERRAWRWLIPYILMSVAALYALYLALFVLVVENAFILIVGLMHKRASRWRLWSRWAIAQVAMVALFVPWLFLALPRMQTWSTATPFDFRLFLRLYLTALSLGISTHIERYTWLVLPFLAFAAFGLALAFRGDTWKQLSALLLTLCMTLPPIAVYLLTLPRSLFYSPRVEVRYLLPFAPPFYILLAWSLWAIWKRARLAGWISAAFLGLVFAWTLPQHYAGRYLRDELQTMTRVIAAYAQTGNAVCVVSGNRFPVFDYYYNHPSSSPEAERKPVVYYLPEGADAFTRQNEEGQLAPISAAHPRLWLARVDATLQDPDGLAKAWFDERYHELFSYRFAHNSLHLYARQETLPQVASSFQPEHVLEASSPPAGMLIGYDLPTAEYRPGDTIHLTLYWQADREATIQVEMRDSRSRVLERQEARLQASQRARQQFDFPIYGRTPPGRYHFVMQALDTPVAGRKIAFGEVRVTRTPPLPRVGRIEHSLALDLGHLARLEGYSLQVRRQRGVVRSLEPGDEIELTLFWRAEAKIGERFTVFTHLAGTAFNPATNGPVWAQHDSEPLEGGLPTTQWFPGEIIADTHLLAIDPHAPEGEYELEVGLYRLLTGERLTVWDRDGQTVGDRVLLGRWSVQRN